MPEIKIKCPKCETELRFRRTSAAEMRFRCSKCNQLIKIPATEQRSAADNSTASLSTNPSTLSPLARSPAPTNRRSKTTLAVWIPIAIGLTVLAGIVVVVGIGIGVFFLFPSDLLSDLNPLGDSPASIVEGLREVVEETAVQIESIDDVPSRDAAIVQLDKLVDRAKDLQKRAIRLGTVPEAERSALVQRYNREVEPLRDRLKEGAARLRERRLGSDRLFEASFSVAISISDVGTAMEIGWREMPEPENQQEELEYAKANIQRDIWRSTASVTSQADYVALGDELFDAADRYRDLAPLQKSAAHSKSNQSSGISRYFDFTHGFVFQTTEKMIQLQTTYGENQRISEALAAIQNAESQLTGIEIEAENRRILDNMGRPGAPRPPMPNGMTARPPQRTVNAQTTGNGQRVIGEPGGAGLAMSPQAGGEPSTMIDLGAPDGSEDSTREQILQRFVSRHGLQNIVILRVSNASDLRPGVLAQALLEHLGTRAFFATRPSEDAIIAIRFPDEIDEVVKHIDWGTIRSIDSERRLIFVDGS